MKDPNVPESYSDLLTLAKKADCVNFHRAGQALALSIDDLEADRRTCINFSFLTGKAEVRVLRGFDPVKDQWSEYVGPAIHVQMPSRCGAKALRGYIEDLAIAKTRQPNPVCFSWYRPPVAVAA